MISCLLKGVVINQYTEEGETMVIEVSYHGTADSKQGRSRRSKYFEVNDVPPRQTVVRRLRMLTVNFDKHTVSIDACHEDVNTLRRAGYLVFRF